MDRWEYMTLFVEAKAENTLEHLAQLGIADPPRNTPLSMMPQLNALGNKGWELVHMEPVIVGTNHDVLLHAADRRCWTSNYFTVLKRKA